MKTTKPDFLGKIQFSRNMEKVPLGQFCEKSNYGLSVHMSGKNLVLGIWPEKLSANQIARF